VGSIIVRLQLDRTAVRVLGLVEASNARQRRGEQVVYLRDIRRELRCTLP
jgi:hypothetical protein